MRSQLCSTFVLFFAFCAPICAQSTACKEPQILRALKKNEVNGSDSFCAEYIASLSYIGTLREDPTFFFYATVTDTASTEVVYKYKATTTREVVTSTSYASQKRTGQNFTMPLPSYVQQYPASRVSAGCSCYIGPGPTYTQYRVCEQATTTTRYSTTFTYTVGRPGTITSTYTDTSTKTKLKSTSAPFPSYCPQADNVDYVATDRSQWERHCGTGFTQYRYLDTVKAPDLISCIEKCVEYNTNLGYKQCQGVVYTPKTNNCDRNNQVVLSFGSGGGLTNVAILKFLPPEPKSYSDYCATVSGAVGN